MSGVFIATYAGQPVMFPALRLLREEQAGMASQFASAGDGWFECYRHGFSPDRCEVILLEDFLRRADGPARQAEGSAALHASEENNLKGT